MRYCLATADAGRCRIFVLDAPDERGENGSATLAPLREVDDLINPERRLADAHVFSDSRPGLRRSGGRARPPSGRHAAATGHGVDDRRQHHRLGEDRRFAADICARIARTCRDLGECTLVLAAPPRMLGLLRDGMADTCPAARVNHVDKDVTSLSLPRLHDYFAAAQLLPARGRRRRF